MGLFSSSKKKADLPPEKKHGATIVDLADTDAEQGSEWKFETPRVDIDKRLCDIYTYDYLSSDYSLNENPHDSHSDNTNILVYSNVINKNIFNLGRILKRLTEKVDKVLAQNKELQDRCDSLENEVKVLKR